MRRADPTAIILFASVVAAAVPSEAQAPACDDARPFRVEEVVPGRFGLREPLKMDFDMDASGKVDVWFVERSGKLRHWSAASGTVVDHGKVPVHTQGEHGLTGLALDPGFKTNRRVFLAYSVRGAAPAGVEYRLARHTLGDDGMLREGSSSILLRIPASGVCNTISALRFDGEGNLFVSVGESQAGEKGAANTADLRGKILRIRPNDTGGYDIPPGNLFAPGRDSTRPEIYVMGVRNPYALAYDPAAKRLGWGELGPDQGLVTEEYNATVKPGNFGWPYFAGYQGILDPGKVQDPAAPEVLDRTLEGLGILPPMISPVHSYRQSGSLVGPFYRPKAGEDPYRLPSAFDGAWFVTDWNQGFVDTLRLDAAGTGRAAIGRLPNLRLDRPVDFRQGPDGALYVMNWNSGFTTAPVIAVTRLVYQGCAPVAVRPGAGREGDGPFAVGRAKVEIRGRYLHVTGGHVLRLRDARGTLLRESGATDETGGTDHDVAALAAGSPGIYLAEIGSGTERRVFRIVLAGP